LGEPVRSHILALLEADDNSHQVVESLQRSGHKVMPCKRFIDAVSILEKGRFDLVISDVHLENGGSVFDFIIWVRRNASTRETPFAMFSYHPSAMGKYVEDGVRTTARLLGVAKYISMDEFDSDDFRRQIDALLPKSDEVAKPSTHEKWLKK